MKKLYVLLFCLLTTQILFSQQEMALYGTWSDPSLVGSSAYNNAYNEIWGLEIDGHEFAVIGSTAGTHFIDISDSTDINEAFFVAGAFQGAGVIHRDYHDYKGYLYAVCDEGGSSTLQIIDISTLPDSITVVYDSQTLLKRAHNIFIDTATAKLYALATSHAGGYDAMAIFDISNPTNPTLLGEYNSFGGNGIGHVHDAYVRNDTAYLNCGTDGFFVVNFVDPLSPQLLGQLNSYSHQGYNHSGWLTDDGQHYVMADENHGKDMKMLDVSDLGNIEIDTLFDAEATSGLSIPHNQLIMGDYLYTSYYYDGLQIHDISDPTNPVRVYYYDTYPGIHNSSYEGAWGVFPFLPSGKILVSDMQTGLYVLKLPTSVSTASVIAKTDFTVYPSPFDDQLTVNINLENAGKVQFEIFDMMGKKILDLGSFDLVNGKNQLNLPIRSDLASGVYVLRIWNDGVWGTRKVVKK